MPRGKSKTKQKAVESPRKNRRRNGALVRCLLLKAKLEGGRYWSLRELSDEFQVHQRTIRRDIEVLEEIGVAIMRDELEQMWGVLQSPRRPRIVAATD